MLNPTLDGLLTLEATAGGIWRYQWKRPLQHAVLRTVILKLDLIKFSPRQEKASLQGAELVKAVFGIPSLPGRAVV